MARHLTKSNFKCQISSGKIQGVKSCRLNMDNLKKMIKIDFDKIKHL